MPASLTRIGAVYCRQIYLLRRSLIRVFDVMFWPVMEFMVWGFMVLYIQKMATGPITQSIVFLLGALIGWDINCRGQLAMNIAALEDIWTRNIIQVLISPIRLWEWLLAVALYTLTKVGAITLVLALLAWGLYAFNLLSIGWTFLPLAANLFLFGWALGLFTFGLLLRYGNAAEALTWGVPFVIQPFSCVFYPLETLPGWAQLIARLLPTTYIFEGLRKTVSEGAVAWNLWATIAGLNLLYAAGGLFFVSWMLKAARRSGQLCRLGQE